LKFLILLLPFLLLANSTFLQINQPTVVIRIDDIQDLEQGSTFAEAQTNVLEYHIEQKIPVLIAIIASDFGSDEQLLDTVKRGIQLGVFTPAIHGWYHEPLTNYTPVEQLAQIKMAEAKLESLLGVEVNALVPPNDAFNDATVEAARESNLTLISSSIYSGDIPRIDNGMLFIPETVSTAELDATRTGWVPDSLKTIIDQTQQSWAQYGTATIVLHPRQFLDANQTWDKNRWDLYLQTLEWVRLEGGQIINAHDARPVAKNTSNVNWLFLGGLSVAVPVLAIAYRYRSKARSKPTEDRTKW
jgi:peptidoglycan/xylan/chitin deacetylase (PgdA/CDA1 family)